MAKLPNQITMQNHIHIVRESHYGCTRYYLAADHHSQSFADGLRQLTGRKSITETDIEGLRKLGFHVHLTNDSLPLKHERYSPIYA